MDALKTKKQQAPQTAHTEQGIEPCKVSPGELALHGDAAVRAIIECNDGQPSPKWPPGLPHYDEFEVGRHTFEWKRFTAWIDRLLRFYKEPPRTEYDVKVRNLVRRTARAEYEKHFRDAPLTLSGFFSYFLFQEGSEEEFEFAFGGYAGSEDEAKLKPTPGAG
jgi:hypothetical protein